MLARDIMTKTVITVGADEKVDKVAQILLENKISGVPVIDENRHVLGVISEKDLVIKASELKVPFYVTLFDSIIFLENPIHFNNTIKKFTALKVKDAMTKEAVTVEEDMELDDIVQLMQKKQVNRVPVIRNNKLVGIISRNDVLKAVVGEK
jgi:CBS domain-containing protein